MTMQEMPPPTIAALMAGDLAVVVADKNGNVTEINQHFERIFGWSATEIAGQPLTVILPPFFKIRII